MKKHKFLKAFGAIVLAAFILLNIIAYNNAYHFTHFSKANIEAPKPESLSTFQKLEMLLFGVEKSKSVVEKYPSKAFSRETIYADKDTLRAWLIKADSSKGIVIMFHGYGSNKGDILTEANAINKLGYITLLVDMRGHGESSGYKTTIGYFEADDVVASFNYIKKLYPQSRIYLHGISMGAVAILEACSKKHLKPNGVIAECPYGSMLHAAENRFAILGVPSFPSAELLVFWGGLQNGFWAFDNNSIASAEDIKVPVLLIYGEKDPRATPNEIKQIYYNLQGYKRIEGFENAGHESYCKQNPEKWKQVVGDFLSNKFQ